MCEYCGENIDGSCPDYKIHPSFYLVDESTQELLVPNGNNTTMYLREYSPTLWSIICELADEEGNVVETPVDFCPKCGRKLI